MCNYKIRLFKPMNASPILPDAAHKLLATARRPHVTVKPRLHKRCHDAAITCD